METDFLDFNEEKKFSNNSNLSNEEEMMKDHLGLLESLKTEIDIPWSEPDENQYDAGREDFQQIMSDWQQHVGFLPLSDPEDMGLDGNLDLLNTDLFEEIKESPILTKALTSPVHKSLINTQSVPGSLDVKKFSYKLPTDSSEVLIPSPIKNKIASSIKTEPTTVVRKLTLINSDKEILGKNIVNLHCLDQIEMSPDENCKITSTVINGKRYRIIIKPRSQKAKRLSEEKIRKTLIKKLSECSWVPKAEPKEEYGWAPKIEPKAEPKEDEIISEMCNGDYDVPLLGNELYTSWDLSSLDAELNQVESAIYDFVAASTTTVNEMEAAPKKVPPLKIKIPKNKKTKKKKSEVKQDSEEVDVETVCDKGIQGNSLTDLLTSFESTSEVDVANEVEEVKGKQSKEGLTNENIKNSLPKEMVHRIESLKRKKDGRIPLIQAIPTKKATKNGTRMQDAGATMNRNKLLKIVSGGDTVKLDHDYCSHLFKKTEEAPKKSKQSKQLKVSKLLKLPESTADLTEKNPKKDSGMESGDVSDASEEPHTPESLQNVQALKEINSKILKERMKKDHANVTKAAAEFFRASNATKSNCNSDSVKTKTVSNGNKALTNESSTPSTPDSDSSVIVPSNSDNSGKEGCNNDDDNHVKSINESKVEEKVRPKKKLKLEEYLSRRNEKKKAVDNNVNVSSSSNDNNDKNSLIVEEPVVIKTEPTEIIETNTAKDPEPEPEPEPESNKELQIPVENEKKTEKTNEKREETIKRTERSRKSRQYRSRRSPSSSSGERDERRKRSRSRSKSKSRSRSRSRRNSRRENQGRYRNRRSPSRDRKRSTWSRSSSRSTSRESSSSSDRPARYRRSKSPIRYRRRSRSRSFSRDRSRSRNRGYSNRQRQNYFKRNYNNRRSRSPFRVYTVREKQRQIEERRVIYVGRIEEGMTNSRLRERFSVFGPIIDISIHFREHGDNYGFVTYAYKDDAYDAVEHGNDDPDLPRYDLCFGGRRGFCKERYADLDGMPTSYSGFNDMPVVRSSEESFDLLLKEFQATMKKRKHSSKT